VVCNYLVSFELLALLLLNPGSLILIPPLLTGSVPKVLLLNDITDCSRIDMLVLRVMLMACFLLIVNKVRRNQII